MQQTLICPKCGSQNPSDYRFCGACGTRLVLHCPYCGASVSTEHRFCGNCGAALVSQFQLQAEDASEDEHEKEEPDSIEASLSYIADNEVRELATAFVREVESWEDKRLTINPIASGISLKVMGRVFCCLWPARTAFTVSYYGKAGKWTDYKVTTTDSLEKAQRLAKQSLEYTAKD